MGLLPGVRQPGVQISKWRWGPLERPVEPTAHRRAPRATACSVRTAVESRWQWAKK